MHRSSSATIIFMFLFTTLLLGCSEQPPDSSIEIEKVMPAPVSLPGDEVVLARVNGSNITRYDLERAIQSTMDENSRRSLDSAVRRKILESLVAGRAIAQARMVDLNPEDDKVLERKVAAYREELLVKQYLAKHILPQPVTPEMVESHYQAHPERFGGKTIRTYEMIAGSGVLTDQERDSLLAALKNPDKNSDWPKWVKVLREQGLPVDYRKGQIDEKVLHPQVQKLMQPLEKGGPSRLGFIKGAVYLVRITDERKLPPRPLNEVSAQIRKSLAPVQLKAAVRKASEEVLETADVVYF